MKKFFCSNFVKIIAFILFTASVTLGCLSAAYGIITYFGKDSELYAFENSFSECKFFDNLLAVPETELYSAYYSVPQSQASHRTDMPEKAVLETEPDEETEPAGHLNEKAVRENILQRLSALTAYEGKIDYYISWNELVFTDCEASSAEELADAAFFTYYKRDEYGNVTRKSNGRYYIPSFLEELPVGDVVTVGARINKNYEEECRSVWETQAYTVNRTINTLIFLSFVALISFIFMAFSCGKRADGTVSSPAIDKIPSEIHIFLAAVFPFAALLLSLFVLDECISNSFSDSLALKTVACLCSVASAVSASSLLSLIRSFKCGNLKNSSIIYRVFSRCLGTALKALKFVYRKLKAAKSLIFLTASKKGGALLITGIFVYSAAIWLFGALTAESAVFILLSALLFIPAFALCIFRAKDIFEIKKGVSEIRNGNLSYKIPELKCEDLKCTAENINDIAKGLDESVSAKLKAERLKTELITNVSHDLKTPITSIINYTELLQKIPNLTEEATDYINILAKKSARLKALTSDLFDIAKAQSGNETVSPEVLDVSLLIGQTLAEFDSEIQKSEITFSVDTKQELYIKADGKKMSRVFSNLVNNVLKYSMKNTRAFITSYQDKDNVVTEVKNISSYPITFSADEIVGRFVRGDESRSTEGSGLGLAIAKSYTELSGGKFKILIDGDMFKARLTFKKIS